VKFHHVGFAVPDIPAAMPGFLQLLGATWNGRIFSDPLQKVKVAFLSTGSGEAKIELVAPGADDSPVTRFLSEKGGGLHHLCYEVDNLEGQLARMRSEGALIVKRPKPAIAFDGRRIAWILSAERLLVELLEAKPLLDGTK
jgi:methylmalonyl-CoA/ethylmalonyl-CoA epimerase